MEPFSAKEAITLAIASVGAVLGILNTWKSYDKDRPKLKVMPKTAVFTGSHGVDQRPRLCIEATNLSTFPLTVTEFGVMFVGTTDRGVFLEPLFRDGGNLPRTLEPRTSITAYMEPEALHGNSHPIKCAYVQTDCGLMFKGKSPALQGFARSAKRG